jgi:D-alanyl-D-alanine carboxypeptidase (penicillin-binding protein 5/6)
MNADWIGNVQVGSNSALQAAAPNLSFPTGILETMDGRVLWARDPGSHVAMASTTKIMTAVVALENSSLDTSVTVDKTAASVGQSSMGLVVGERFTMGELLKGVLIESGNDAATLVAERVGGTVARFVAMMNAKAAALDLTNTHYMNPHGLDQTGHYTSAADLTALARYAMRIPAFRTIVGTYTAKVRSNLYTHVLQNHNDLLKSYPGAEGVKTGWTDNAGYCVVLAAKRGPVELIGAVMGTPDTIDRARQAKVLFDWGFAHYKPVEVTSAGRSFGRVPVTSYLDRTVTAISAETTSMPVFDLAGTVRYRADLLSGVAAPVQAGDKIGTLTVFQGSTMLAQFPLVADRDVPVPTFRQSVTFFFGRIWRRIFGS